MESRWLLSGSELLQVTSMTPPPGAQLAESPSEIVLTFNRAVGPDSLLIEHLHLEGSGGDGTFGDGNETVLRPTDLRFVNETQVAVQWTGVTIPADRYRLHLGENPRHKFLEFDGIDDQVSTSLNIDQGPGSPGVTFEAWVNPSSLGDGRRHVISTDNGGYDWSILRENDQWHVFTGEQSRSTGFAVEEGRWQHLAAVFEPDRGATFYMDGQESFIPYIGYDVSDGNVAIGRNSRYPEFFAGAIDEVRVWDGTRTADEIRANMHQPLAGTEPGLLGYWKFDEGQGQTVADSSPYGQHGVLGRDAAVGSDDPLWRTELSWPESLDGGMLDGEFTGSFPNGDGDLTPYDVLQVINFINRGESEQGGIDYGWLAALETTSPIVLASMPHSSTIPGLQADQRVDWLADAVDDAAYRTTYRQWGGPFEPETWQRLELRRDPDVWEAADSDLPDWEALLDDPAMDVADLDAYFAAMA